MKLSQPAFVAATIEIAGLAKSTGRIAPYTTDDRINTQTPADVPPPQAKETYRQLEGDPGYLADSTKMDIAFPTGKLAAEIQKLTTRYWEEMKATYRYVIQTKNTRIV